jgi:hypothetical protein
MFGNLYDLDLKLVHKVTSIMFVKYLKLVCMLPLVSDESAQLLKIHNTKLLDGKELMQTVGLCPALHDQQALHLPDHILDH